MTPHLSSHSRILLAMNGGGLFFCLAGAGGIYWLCVVRYMYTTVYCTIIMRDVLFVVCISVCSFCTIYMYVVVTTLGGCLDLDPTLFRLHTAPGHDRQK